MKRLLGALLLVLGAARGLRAQDEARENSAGSEFVRVEFEVTAVSGSELYLDQGREALLQPGDRVRVFPAEGPARSGRIVSVARTSARASLDEGLDGLQPGLRGAVWIPRTRLEEAERNAAGEKPATEPVAPPVGEEPRRVPEHPPWSAPPEEWSVAQPLLAPAHGLAPEERPRRFRAELFSALDLTRDDAGDEPRDLAATTLGFSSRLENPFRHGGELHLEAELYARSSELDGESEQDSRFRLERASYAWGGVRGARDRGEVGRFLQREFPEFGFLDGVEYVRASGPHRLGASFGFLPLPDDTFSSGDDLGAALFYRRASDEARTFSFGGGYQKTWHEGAADRDLLVGELELHPGERTSLFASTLVDLYTSGDTLKSSGPEVTQLFLNATHRSARGHGAGLFFSHLRFPELARDEFDDVTAADIADDVNDRYGTDGWLALGESLQLYGRVEAWSDQDDSGSGLRARVTRRDLFARGETLGLELYTNTGKFSDALGLRASARWRLERGAFDLAWDATQYTQDAVDEDLLQHALRGQYDLALGAWYLALYLESRFGDDQDALSLGFLLQRSFDGVMR